MPSNGEITLHYAHYNLAIVWIYPDGIFQSWSYKKD